MYFIRHGQAENNIKGVFAGTLDYALTDVGHEQADIIGNMIKNVYPNISQIITSPVVRAVQTGEIIAEITGLDVSEEPLLREVNYGDYEDVKCESLGNVDVMRLMQVGKAGSAEAPEEIFGRAKEFIEKYKGTNHKNIIAITHGSIGAAIFAYVAGKDVEGFIQFRRSPEWKFKHGEVRKLQF